MKLRIEHQTIRFRLSQKDLETLALKGQLTETLVLTPSAVWAYSLEATNAFDTPQVNAESQNLKVLLPESMLKQWMNGKDVEWHFKADQLSIDVEKDLKG